MKNKMIWIGEKLPSEHGGSSIFTSKIDSNFIFLEKVTDILKEETLLHLSTIKTPSSGLFSK